jgi:hypothetical protein
MAIVDDVEEHVRGVGTVGEVADFVDHEQRRVSVCNEGVSETSLPKGSGELVDELGSGDEERIESVLDGAVSDGDGEMCFPAAGFSHEDQTPSLGNEVRERAEPSRDNRTVDCRVKSKSSMVLKKGKLARLDRRPSRVC